MKLVHFSDEIVTLQPGFTFPGEVGYLKPRGLWVSVEGEIDGEESFGWREWCEGEGFGLDRLAYQHEVTLVADADVLWIRNAAELDAFDEQWRKPSRYPDLDVRRNPRIDSHIDWAAVARCWRGLIIAPYLWSRRIGGPFWYYGWDCASGCIWDTAAIQKIELIDEAALEATA